MRKSKYPNDDSHVHIPVTLRPQVGEAAARSAEVGLSLCLSPLLLADPNGKLVFANRAAKRFFALVDGQDFPPLPALLQRHLAKSEQQSELRLFLARPGNRSLCLTFHNKAKQAHQMLLRQQPLSAIAPDLVEQLAPLGGAMLLQLDDVTALTEDFDQRAENTQADALLDLLGTNMSDLEYPLGALRWMAELEEDELHDNPQVLRRQLRSVRKASRHLVGMFDNLRLPTQGEDLDQTELDVVRVLVLGTTPTRAAHLIDRLRNEGLRLLFRAGRNAQDVLRAAQANEADVVLVDRHLPSAEAEDLGKLLEDSEHKLLMLFVQEDSAAMAKELRQATHQAEMVGEGDKVWRRLEELALRDSLTGVLNRRAFERFGGQEFDRARRYQFPLSLAFFDLDHFKQVNDRLGHAAGDRMLQVFASYLQTATRQSDMVARLGGDEFAVLMSHTDGAGALILTQRLRDSVELHLREVLPPLDPEPGVSVGLAVFPEREVEDFSALIDAADQALYRAKRAGRGRLGTD